jgi:hypothetical protein
VNRRSLDEKHLEKQKNQKKLAIKIFYILPYTCISIG